MDLLQDFLFVFFADEAPFIGEGVFFLNQGGLLLVNIALDFRHFGVIQLHRRRKLCEDKQERGNVSLVVGFSANQEQLVQLGVFHFVRVTLDGHGLEELFYERGYLSCSVLWKFQIR